MMRRRLTAPVVLVILNIILALLAPGGTWALDARSQRMSAVASPPTVTSVSPDRAYNYQETDVTITGTGFFTITGTGLIVPTVYLGNVPLNDVTFISSTTLTATVPADLPGGTYTLTVTNPDSQNASLANAFTVLHSGDGSLGFWESTASMPESRSAHGAAEARGYIYVIGGYGGETHDVVRAQVNADSSMAPWQVLNSPMTKHREGLAVARSGHYLYALGPDSSVEWALVNPDGSLGQWQATSSMITARLGLAAVALGDYIYAIGGFGGGALNSVERALINADGSLGAWQVATSMSTQRGMLSAVVVGNYLYAIGGGHPTLDVLDSVERAAINSDGSLGDWRTVSSMITPRRAPSAVAVGGYIYAMGGSPTDFNTGCRSVERAQVHSDGSLGSWEAVFSMTTARFRFAAVTTGGYIYALGGETTNSVERAEITDGMLPTGHGVSINDGALFTNKVTVTLTIGLEPDTPQMQVSNDGGFAGAEWEPYAPLKAWTITQYGNYVIPRVVYVRYKDHDGNTSSTCQDDIILDVNAPTGSVDVTPGVSGSSSRTVGAEAATIYPLSISATGDHPYDVYLPLVLSGFCTLPTGPANITLHLQSEDDLSGVADMMISHLPDCRCGTWEPYSTTKTWYVPDEATTIYVKFRDNAGNVSEVVTDAITW